MLLRIGVSVSVKPDAGKGRGATFQRSTETVLPGAFGAIVMRSNPIKIFLGVANRNR